MKLLAYVHLRNIHRSTGAGRVARALCERIGERPGVDMRVLADAGDYRRIVPQVGGAWETYRYHFFANETSRQQARWYLWNRPVAEQYWPEADIVWCTGESYVPVRSARLAVTVHDAQMFDRGALPANAALWKQRLKWKWLFGRLARKADLFHTVSEFSAERLSHYFPAIRSRLCVVPNAVSPRFFEPVPEAGLGGLRRLGLADRAFVLVPGGLHYRKNADLILESWPRIRAAYPDLTLAIANHSDPVYAEKARALGPSVLLTGFVDDDELRALYGAATLVWFPSRYEGFGLPVIEAMASGTAVVTSNTSSLPEVAGGAALLLSPDRPSEHVDAITGLLTDHGARTEWERKGKQRAAEFTWERSANTLAGHFASLL